MRHIEIYLPFALPQSRLPYELLSHWEAPALARLLSRARCENPSLLPVLFAHALPHEVWMAYRAGLIMPSRGYSNIPVATRMMETLGLAPCEGFWFVLNPVHIQVTLDKLLLWDRRQLHLTEAESRALFEAAKPGFVDRGLVLVYGDAMNWFVQADDWNNLQTSTPGAATGRHIEYWLPHGEKETEWRVLLNEIQMLWHRHAVNAHREESGLPPVNALWLWGGSHVNQYVGKQEGQSQAFYSFFSGKSAEYLTCDEWFSQTSKTTDDADVVIDHLSAAALSGDWYDWLRIYDSLERDWFVPLLQLLKEGGIEHLTMHMDNDEKMLSFFIKRSLLRRFWIRPSLKRLFA